MMHMTFYWGTRVTLLFDIWKTDSATSYALSLIACLFAAVFYQYMEDRRQRFRLVSSLATRKASDHPSPIEAPLLHSVSAASRRLNPARFAGAALFAINSAIGYLLMLAIMSFNGGVFIAVVSGLAVGYLIFRGVDEEDVVVVDNPCACA